METQGRVSRDAPAPLGLHMHPMALVDPAFEDAAWPAAGKGRA